MKTFTLLVLLSIAMLTCGVSGQPALATSPEACKQNLRELVTGNHYVLPEGTDDATRVAFVATVYWAAGYENIITPSHDQLAAAKPILLAFKAEAEAMCKDTHALTGFAKATGNKAQVIRQLWIDRERALYYALWLIDKELNPAPPKPVKA